jgi:hypothetical protein
MRKETTQRNTSQIQALRVPSLLIKTGMGCPLELREVLASKHLLSPPGDPGIKEI